PRRLNRVRFRTAGGSALTATRRWVLTELRTPGARHSAVTLAGQVGQVGLSFLASVLLARTLGPEGYGLVAVVSTVFVLADTLGDFGLTAAAVRAIAHAEAPAHTRRLVQGYVALAILTNLIAAAIGILLAGPIATIILNR